MSFDLFGKTQKKDIRVGYISTDRGYVKGITILEANKYAFLNPGTVFILQTRDSTRYLNINEVNKLTSEDVLPSNTSGEGNLLWNCRFNTSSLFHRKSTWVW